MVAGFVKYRCAYPASSETHCSEIKYGADGDCSFQTKE